MYSAIRVAGERLYEAARRGETVDRAPRRVTFRRLDVVEWRSPALTVDVACSKGTYIRSLAHDLGQALGTGAHLSNLVRTWTGPFRLNEAWTLADLEAALADDPTAEWASISIHPDTIVQGWPAIVVADADRTGWLQGRTVPGPPSGDETGVRAYDADGHWLGIGHGSAMGTRPWKVVRNDVA